MASFSSIPKTNFHARSISFPSKSNQLSELDDSIATTSSSSSISQEIDGLNNLFKSVEQMLVLPTTQRALSLEGQNDVVNELLDKLLRLLDLCTTAKDALLMTRNSAQELQSVLRRKKGNPIELAHAIQEYQAQRKTVKKSVLKTLKNSKSCSTRKIQETTAIVALRKVESVTFKVLESLLCMILGSNTKKWTLVSKLMGSKRVACDEAPEISLVKKVDVELANKSTNLQVENVQKELALLEISLEDHQDGLESIYRHMIKTRVSLLNLLNC